MTDQITTQEETDGKPIVRLIVPNRHTLRFVLGDFTVTQDTHKYNLKWTACTVKVEGGTHNSKMLGTFGIFLLQTQACLSILEKRVDKYFAVPFCEEVERELIDYLTTAGYHVELVENVMFLT